MRTVIRALVALFVIGCWTQPAAAQDRERARVLFDEATAARETGDWARVRSLLEQSLVAFPTFGSAWNLVTALEELDDLPAAEAHLMRLQAGDFGELDEARTAAVAERLASVSAELGTIVIETGVADLLVRVDGVARAHTEPSGQVRVRAAAGSHVVVVSSEEGQVLERELDLERGASRTLRFSFVSRIEPATLLLEAADPTRTVRVVGVADGLGRLELTLAPSEYRLELVGGGATRMLVLSPGQNEHVVLVRTEEVWESPWFWVTLGALALGGAGAAVGVYVGTNQVLPPVPADFVAQALR